MYVSLILSVLFSRLRRPKAKISSGLVCHSWTISKNYCANRMMSFLFKFKRITPTKHRCFSLRFLCFKNREVSHLRIGNWWDDVLLSAPTNTVCVSVTADIACALSKPNWCSSHKAETKAVTSPKSLDFWIWITEKWREVVWIWRQVICFKINMFPGLRIINFK